MRYIKFFMLSCIHIVAVDRKHIMFQTVYTFYNSAFRSPNIGGGRRGDWTMVLYGGIGTWFVTKLMWYQKKSKLNNSLSSQQDRKVYCSPFQLIFIYTDIEQIMGYCAWKCTAIFNQEDKRPVGVGEGAEFFLMLGNRPWWGDYPLMWGGGRPPYWTGLNSQVLTLWLN